MRPSLGWGTYRVDRIVLAAPVIASAGCNWIDTAPNYSHGYAHRDLAPILAAHPSVRVSTKVGFFDTATGEAAHADGVLGADEAAAGHSLRPSYLRWQIERSRADLGRDRLSLLFLHNPEHATTNRMALGELLVEAFAELETAVRDGLISSYGVSTWSGFTNGAFTVEDLLHYAQVATGTASHHLRAVQLPVSLVQLDPIAQALDRRGPMAEASFAGLEVFTSAPLHGGGLVSMVEQELADLIRPGLTPAEAALAVIAATPGVSRILLSTSQAAHWTAARDVLAADPLDTATLRKVVDVLAS